MRFGLLALLLALMVGCGTSQSVAPALPPETPPQQPSQTQPASLPGGAPPALYRSEPVARSPSDWPFPEAFPKTSGFARLAGGAVYWSGFLYDDHGALGAFVGQPPVITSPPIGTYIYPPGPAHENGADIAAAALGLDGEALWFRVDWQTLADPNLPLAMWALDTDDDAATGAAQWPHAAGVSSAGIERWLLMSAQGAWLVNAGGASVAVADAGGAVSVDLGTQSFLVRLPRAALPALNQWRVRLASGLANASGDGFAPVPLDRGALPGQPAVYDVAFRSHEQEPLGRDNWWRDKQLALALARGDISDFSVLVVASELAAKAETPEPRPSGWSNRWHFSSVDLGPGISPRTRYYAADFLPNYMGRRQPYGIYVPENLDAAAPLTLLLHSINVQHNQFINWNPAFIQSICEARKSICVAPLGRGADGWWANEAELDMWEVWNRVAAEYPLDATRTVLAGYSMGGYGTYRLGLEHPDLFSAVLVLAGAPACSVRLAEGIEQSAASGNPECDQESDTTPLIENARDVPFYLGHDALDELAPVTSALQQASHFDALGYRHRLEIYLQQDHVVWSNTGTFEGAVRWLQREDRKAAVDPPRISYTWYAQHQRDDLGTGPGAVWWVSGLRAASDAPGFTARIDAVSRALAASVPTLERIREPVLNLDGPALATELRWGASSAPETLQPVLQVDLQGVSAATLDLARAGFVAGDAGVIEVMADEPLELGLSGLSPGASAKAGSAQKVLVDAAGKVTLNLAAGQTQVVIEECGTGEC